MRKQDHDYDVIIVGGSVAGATAAIWLGQAGHHVLVIDRAVFPRDKACGEGIMPAGVQILRELGLLASLQQRGAHPFHGITFRDHHGCSATAHFPDATRAPGLIIRRKELDDHLLERAAALPSVDVRQGFRVTGLLERDGKISGVRGVPIKQPSATEPSVTAPVTLGADGLHSLFHRLSTVQVRRPRRQRFGIRAHVTRVEGLSSQVEVITHPRGEIYIAAHSRETAMVALLLDRSAMRLFHGHLEEGFWKTLRSVRCFAERIENSRLISPMRVAGPLGHHIAPCYGNGFLLIGDSAGALDPITGEGMALSLKNAKLAAGVITSAFQDGDFSAARLSEYGQAWRRMKRPIARLTDLILFLSRHRVLAHGAINYLNAHPKKFQKLLKVAAGGTSSSGR